MYLKELEMFLICFQNQSNFLLFLKLVNSLIKNQSKYTTNNLPKHNLSYKKYKNLTLYQNRAVYN